MSFAFVYTSLGLRRCVSGAYFFGARMKKFLSKLKYFTVGEWLLWGISELFIILSFCIFDRENYFTLISSVLGITSLIFIAKGNPIGQVLMLIFATAYGIVSYSFKYYGEMLTYLCMSAPMALIALISWLKNPFNGKKEEVKISNVTKKTVLCVFALSVAVTIISYFILSALGTANIIPSTISVATSMIAVCFSALRSPYFALAYAVNDVVLIVLWGLATAGDVSYVSVLICFFVFLFNDLYSFFNWLRIKKRQQAEEK